jgi:hypothetical protein
MTEIIATLSASSPHLNRRTLKQLTLIDEAVLPMTGRVTLLGLSRWAEKSGSYRTVQRFFGGKIAWTTLRWRLVKQHAVGATGMRLLTGDEVVVTTSGEEKRAKRGRPKGSANKSRKDLGLSPFQTQLQGCIRATLKRVGVDLDIA